MLNFGFGTPKRHILAQKRIFWRIWQPVERTATVCSTGLYHRFHNRLYTRYSQLSNGFDNRLYRVYKHTTGCWTVLTTGCIV